MTPAALLALALLAAAPDAGPAWTLGPRPRAEVRRVVTLAPSLTDVVLALGAGERLVGVSRFDERPEVRPLPRVGGFLDPSVEAVVALKPDLVLVQPGPGNERPVRAIASLGVPVLLLPLESVADVLAAERAVGRSLGLAAAGDALARRLEDARARVRARSAALPRPRVLFVYGVEPLVVAGPGSFAAALLEDVGAVNVAADATSPYPVYSVERALASRPDLVVDAANVMGGQERLRALPGLREARWVTLADRALLHPGPALEQGLETLLGLVHPAATADAGPSAPARPPGPPRPEARP